MSLYGALISHLKTHGDVLTEHVGDYSLSLYGQNDLSDTYIHDRDVEWLLRSDVVVAEVTTPSLGVGYEIATAVEHDIPVIALFRGKRDRLSAMIAGSSGVTTVTYEGLSDAVAVLEANLPEFVR